MKFLPSFNWFLWFAILAVSSTSYALDEFKVYSFGAGFPTRYFEWETKRVSGESTDVSFFGTNEFEAVVTSVDLSYAVSNCYVYSPNSGIQAVNAYSIRTEEEGGCVTGTYAYAENTVLEVYDEESPEPMLFRFNTTTNVALMQLNEGGEDNLRLGMMVLVRKPEVLVPTSMDGTFVRYTMGNMFFVNEYNGQSNLVEHFSLEESFMAINGATNLTENITERHFYRTTLETPNMFEGETVMDTAFYVSPMEVTNYTRTETCSIQPDGTFLVNSEMGPLGSQISADGNLAVSFIRSTESNRYSGAYLTVAVRQPENMATDPVEAVYYLVWTEHFSDSDSFGRDEVSSGYTYCFLHSDGTFDMRHDGWDLECAMENRRVNLFAEDYVSTNHFYVDVEDSARWVEFEGGTYTISSVGVVSLNFGDEVVRAQLSENGEYLLLGEVFEDEYETDRFFAVGIRRILPAAPLTPVVFEGIEMTPTGSVLTVSLPVGSRMELIYADELLEDGQWPPSWALWGPIDSTTGTAVLSDPGATIATQRFYRAVFEAW